MSSDLIMAPRSRRLTSAARRLDRRPLVDGRVPNGYEAVKFLNARRFNDFVKAESAEQARGNPEAQPAQLGVRLRSPLDDFDALFEILLALDPVDRLVLPAQLVDELLRDGLPAGIDPPVGKRLHPVDRQLAPVGDEPREPRK